MKIKTKILVDRLAKTISEWPGVECICLNEAALPDTLDMYFTLILDVYYGVNKDGSIPDSDERCRLYGDDVAAFESSEKFSHGKSGESKDRFLINDLPVHLEFKSVKLIEERVTIADSKLDSFHLIKDSGTYGFYRLTNGELIFSRSGWINGIRRRIANLDNEFWRLMRNAHQSKMEHFLMDLGAAVIQNDEFNCLISEAGFIKSACLTLFCINRCFEPSHKAYYEQVLKLPVQPESFRAAFTTFISRENSSGMKRSFELAKLLARGIINL